MKTKTVWCDVDGYLVGRTLADESPLEPGHFLLPAGAVATKPPYPIDGKQEWQWDGRQWQAVPLRAPAPPATPEDRLAAFLLANPDIADIIGALRAGPL